MNNNSSLLKKLRLLGLTSDESKIYLELLKDQYTHLELSRKTGINRTKVYRIADDLIKRSIISKQTDDRGTFLIATDPNTLEVLLTTQEERIKAQRNVFEDLLPDLQELKQRSQYTPGFFEVNTYEGVEGMKQMLWHELKAKGEVLIFGSGTIEKLVESRRWAERHRAQTVAAGYKVREIINHGKKEKDFTSLESFKEIFSKKLIDSDTLCLDHQIVIYNNTVAVYNWRNNEKVGVEVLNKSYASMWRQLFEHYWKLAS